VKHSGILLVDKATGSTSFHLVSILRKITRIEKIGHAGTLDPFATGVMVMLIGREYTQKSNDFLSSDKGYLATIQLGSTTDSYDIYGKVLVQNPYVPSLVEVEKAIASFQGQIEQIPPMFSAKKVAGQKLYDLARKGITIERAAVKVSVQIKLIRYHYPMLEIEVNCSKGTYIRSLAHDIGQILTCGAHLFELIRTRSGTFHLSECVSQADLKAPDFDFTKHLRKL